MLYSLTKDMFLITLISNTPTVQLSGVAWLTKTISL
uniref:Uncharacterized protein n=1 Tax=Ciona intestinalis TaxID=7719 RepID=H2XMR2_CIOIN